MNMLDIIAKKKQGDAFTREEIDYWIGGAADGSIADYQLSALLMAICLRGMTMQETTDLTLSMAASGEMADLSAISGRCVDKHSTGGVGDTTTLILVPLVAACGAPVAKMSGRGLGFTGGTLDKLESIPGMRVECSVQDFITQVQRIGCAVIGQSQNIAPADKRLYSLRDVTCTVDSLPLIASSIMSKKIAAGSAAIVLDVKTGNGAIMHTLEQSVDLAQCMVSIGAMAGRPTMALITGMDQPLGTHIGNALEVKEAIDVLSGRTCGRLLHVAMELGSYMLLLSGVTSTKEQAYAALEKALRSGAGLHKLKEMIASQGGDTAVIDDVTRLPQATYQIPVIARTNGYVREIQTTLFGLASQRLGAGRIHKEDIIDPAVGIVLHKTLGDYVEKEESVATIYANDAMKAALAVESTRAAIKIGKKLQNIPPLIYAIVTDKGVEYPK